MENTTQVQKLNAFDSEKTTGFMAQLRNIMLYTGNSQISFDKCITLWIKALSEKSTKHDSEFSAIVGKIAEFLTRVQKLVESYQEELNAQAASNPNMQPTFRSRSSSFPGASGSNNGGQPGSSKLGKV